MWGGKRMSAQATGGWRSHCRRRGGCGGATATALPKPMAALCVGCGWCVVLKEKRTRVPTPVFVVSTLCEKSIVQFCYLVQDAQLRVVGQRTWAVEHQKLQCRKSLRHRSPSQYVKRRKTRSNSSKPRSLTCLEQKRKRTIGYS